MESLTSRLVLGCVCAVGLFAGASCADGASFQPVSVRDSNQAAPVNGNGDSYGPLVSPDGRYVLFSSTADNLVVGTNGLPLVSAWPPPLNVFVRDRLNQTTVLASVSFSGDAGGNSNSFPAGISTNGQFVAFESVATNFFPGDNNRVADIFVRDLWNGSNVLVSVSTNGKVGNFVSRSPVMTPDGRYVAFVSEADNLTVGDANYIPDIYLRDLLLHSTTLVSIGAKASSGTANTFNRFRNSGSSELPSISADGRYVAFYSSATNLVFGVTNIGDIYMRDVIAGTTTWASSYARTMLPGVMGEATKTCFSPVLSADGQYVAFEASLAGSSSAVAAGAVLRFSLASGLTDVIFTNAYVPTGAADELRCLSISPDGRFIAFVANENGNTGATTSVRVWDAQIGTPVLASGDFSNNIPVGSTCAWPDLDASGRYVTFLSTATNLVPDSSSRDAHLYVRDMVAGSTRLVDGFADAGASTGVASVPQMSEGGQIVAFDCDFASLGIASAYRVKDVFIWDVTNSSIDLISVASAELPPSATPNGVSALGPGCISANGRFVVFTSDANDVAAGGTNNFSNIFVRDLWSNTNVLVSVGTNGVPANGSSMEPVISADGRYVAFSSLANNLVPGDANKVSHVFLRDLQENVTYLMSVSTNGIDPGDYLSRSPAISDDGRYVFYRTQARNLGVVKGTLGLENAVVRDTWAGTNYAFYAYPGSITAYLSDGGRFVSFFGFVGTALREYVWDVQLAAPVYSSTALTNAIVSADGNRLAFISNSTSRVTIFDRTANTNWDTHVPSSMSIAQMRFSKDGRFLVCVGSYQARVYGVYLVDCETGMNQFISRAFTEGQNPSGLSSQPDITADGRFIAYRSFATNIVPNDTNTVPDIFVYDRLHSTTTLLGADNGGAAPPHDRSSRPFFSGDGQTLLFQSWSADFTGPDRNRKADIIAYNLYASGDIPLFSVAVSRRLSAQGAIVTWPVIAGKLYQVQFKNNLSDLDWQNVTNGVTLLGNQGSLTDAIGGTGPRFYRVVAY